MIELAKIAAIQDKVWIKRQRSKRQRRLVTEILFDYAKNSTLHGLRYITEKRLKSFEKLFWFITFTISVAFCCYHIANVYVKWINSPVLVTVSERLVSANSVPFPSVTICPQVKCAATVYNVSAMVKKRDYWMKNNNTSAYERNKHEVIITGVCKNPYSIYHSKVEMDVSLIDVIADVSPNLKNTFDDCKWQGERVLCSSIFQVVYTSEGLCFNFNGKNGKDLFRNGSHNTPSVSTDLERKKGQNIKEHNYFSRRGQVNSAYPDLDVLLRTEIIDEDVLCNGINSGYKIYLHHPNDMVHTSLHYHSAAHEQVSSMAISFNILNTSDSLKKYEPTARQCYFPEDRYLQHFQTYSLKNCEIECLANYTISNCRCAAYYMPRKWNTKMCSNREQKCIITAHKDMITKELNWEEKEDETLCRCLPACDSISYEAEVSKTSFNLETFNKAVYEHIYSKTPSANQQLHHSKLELYYKQPHFISLRRSEHFGLTDFVANIGGLLGVFLGFSFLSLIEIIYFLTIRVGLALKKDIRDEKKQRNSIKY